MAYTVVWLPDAEQELAEMWLTAADRKLITLAADEIEKKLGRSPETIGESRSAGRRILIVPPLAIIYRVLPDDCIVRVIDVSVID